MKDKIKRIFSILLNKEESIGDILKRELGELTPEEGEKLLDFFDLYYKRKIMKSAEKDKKVFERIHKFAGMFRESQPK